jgi:hypothetical protein
MQLVSLPGGDGATVLLRASPAKSMLSLAAPSPVMRDAEERLDAGLFRFLDASARKRPQPPGLFDQAPPHQIRRVAPAGEREMPRRSKRFGQVPVNFRVYENPADYFDNRRPIDVRPKRRWSGRLIDWYSHAHPIEIYVTLIFHASLALIWFIVAFFALLLGLTAFGY